MYAKIIVPPPSFTRTNGWFDVHRWDEVPDVDVADQLPDGWYLVSPDGYFWGPLPTVERLDREVFTGAGPGGPTLDAGPDDWFVQITGGVYGAAYRPVAESRPLTCKENS